MKRTLTLCAFFSLATFSLVAQNNAPVTPQLISNPGFELGDFTGWTGYIGDNTTSSFGPLDNIAPGIVSTTMNAPLTDMNARHTIVSSAFGMDPYGNFPVVPANLGNFTARLGGMTPNYQGEILEQSWLIDPGQPYLKINYAIVLNGGGHPANQSPYFRYELLDGTGSPLIPGVYLQGEFDTTFTASPSDPSTFYRAWVTDSIDLSAWINTQLTIRFTVAGCTQSGHFGYCYVDVDYPYLNSVAENQLPEMRLFPNPGSGLFNLYVSGNTAKTKPVVTDMLGREIAVPVTQTADGWQIDMTGEAAGTYTVSLTSPAGKVVQKLVVQ
jgi:hypothetical protein